MKTTIGKTLKFLRQRHYKLSLRQLGLMIGITHVHLCNIEQGKGQPSLDMLEKLSEYYKVDIIALDRVINGISAEVYRLAEQHRRTKHES